MEPKWHLLNTVGSTLTMLLLRHVLRNCLRSTTALRKLVHSNDHRKSHWSAELFIKWRPLLKDRRFGLPLHCFCICNFCVQYKYIRVLVLKLFFIQLFSWVVNINGYIFLESIHQAFIWYQVQYIYFCNIFRGWKIAVTFRYIDL